MRECTSRWSWLVVLFCGCSLDDPQKPTDAFVGASPAVDDGQSAADDALVATLTVQGAEVQFFAWDDGSAGVLEASDGQLTASLDEMMAYASVAEVFWALSDDGQAIPDELLRHHVHMAGDWGTSADPRLGDQGWLAREPARVPASSCTNATFNSNICGSGTYPDGPSCFNNVTGSISWTTAATSRYRAGVCVQSGSANDYLSYEHYSDASSCNTTCGASHTVWGYSWNTYSSPLTSIYLNWWWVAPSTAARRKWRHSGSNHSGAVYDWGTKTLDTTDCTY